jgi:hypothetical protein
MIVVAALLLSLLVACAPRVEDTTPSIQSTPQTVLSSTSSPSYDVLVKEGYLFPEISRISCEDLKQRMDKQEDILIIDIRDEFEMMEGHLAGAISIPYAIGMPGAEEMMDKQLDTLPDSKLKVFYCY